MNVTIKAFNPDAKLCYISDQTAYFTTQDLNKQWGDDWDDAPYEHNAGSPYEYHDGDKERGVEKWEIFRMYFESYADTPESVSCRFSPYSVEDINNGAVAWLYYKADKWRPGICIMAGTTIAEFIRVIISTGGKVFLEAEEVR